MSNFKIVFKNTFFLTISEFVLKIIGFIWVIYLARSLSIVEYGRYNFINSFIAIFSVFPDLGIGLIIIREIAKNKGKASLYLGNSLIINSFFAFLTMIAILLSVTILGYQEQTKILILIASITLFISTVRSVGVFYFEGVEKMGFSAFLSLINTLLLISFGFIGFILGFGLKGIFLGMLTATICSLIITWGFTKNYLVPKISLNFKLIKHLVLEGLPLGLAAFAFMLYTRIDAVLLARLLDEKSVGVYSAATPFVFSLIQLLNVPFMMAVYPTLSRIYKDDKKRFNYAIKKSLIFVSFWSFPVALVGSIISPIIIPLVFGHKYDEAIPILRILIFFVPFASLSALLYKTLIIINKQRIYLLVSVIGAIINIVLNLILIPKFFIIGAAYASVSTQIILFILYIAIIIKLLKKTGELK